MSQKSVIKINSPRFTISNGKSPRHIDVIEKQAKLTPGVGRYNPNRKPKIKGTYTIKVSKSGFTDEAIFFGNSSPSHYPAINPDFYKTKR